MVPCPLQKVSFCVSLTLMTETEDKPRRVVLHVPMPEALRYRVKAAASACHMTVKDFALSALAQRVAEVEEAPRHGS